VEDGAQRKRVNIPVRVNAQCSQPHYQHTGTTECVLGISKSILFTGLSGRVTKWFIDPQSDGRALPSRQQAPSSDMNAVLEDSATLFSKSSQAPSSTDTDRSKPNEKQKLSISFWRGLTSVWSKRRRPAPTLDETRGPLGLRLLASSPEPLIDLIFVHGLRGGSIKTWQKQPDPQYFWPKYWLPLEPELSHANIHSFGYNSDWSRKQPNIFNVHDFGKELYEELRSSPLIRQQASVWSCSTGENRHLD